MNKKKTTKLITRIICGILIFIMIAGLIVPYAFATEVEDVDTTAEVTDEVVTDDTIDAPHSLPLGYSWVEKNGHLVIEKDADNTETAIIIDGVHNAFNNDMIVAYIGNLETKEVIKVAPSAAHGFLISEPLEDGYYVLFTNGYAYEDANGNIFSINGGTDFYFYVGDKYESTKYAANVHNLNNEIAYVTLKNASGTDVVVKNIDATVEISTLPLEHMPNIIGGAEEPVETAPEQPTQPNVDSSTPEPVEPEEDDGGLWVTIGGMLKKSAWIIILFVGCQTALIVIQHKKKQSLEKQKDNDKYDEGFIE